MKIWYTFPISNIEDFNVFKNYDLISSDKDDRDLCIYRERYQEIEYFSSKNHALFFNKENNSFTTPDFKTYILTENDIIFPRIDIRLYERFFLYGIPAEISVVNCNLIQSKENYKKINYWHDFVPSQYLNRKSQILDAEDCSQNFKKYFDTFKDSKNRFFIKSVYKHWSYAGSYEGWIECGAAFSLEAQAGKVLISEFLEIKEDEFPCLYIEYRCFYILGKLRSVSRYVDYEEHEIPQHIVDLAKRYENEIVGKFLPENVVIDIADTYNKGPVFLEANDPCCSGRYVMNKIESFPLEE